MADKSMQLVIGVDIKDVNAAINKTKALEGQVKRIVDAHRSGKIDIDNYNRGLSETKKSYDSVSASSRKSSAEIRKLAKQFKEAYDTKSISSVINKTNSLEAEVKKIVAAYRVGKISTDEYNKGLLQTKRAYDSISPSSQKATAEVRKLAKEFNRAYDTQEQVANLKRLEAEQTRAFAAARREATLINQQKIMEAKAAAKAVSDAAKQEVAAFRAARKEAELMNKQFDMERAASGLMKSQKAAKRFQLGVQQAGYQVGDFAVQVASGTNPLVAFSQQATQLVGFFGGPWGAAVGAGIAILSGLGLAFMNVNGLGKTTKEVLEDIKETIDGFSSVSDSLEKALVSPIDNSNKALVSYLKNLKAAKAEETLKAVSGGIGTILKPYIEMQDESEAKIRSKGRNLGRGNLLEAELEKLSVAKEINYTLAEATTGPAEDLGQNLLKAMESLRTSGLLTEDLKTGLTDLLETTGLRAQAEQQNTEKVKEQVEKAKKQAELADAIINKRIELRKIEDAATKALNDEIALLLMKKQFGEDSNTVRLLEAQIARETYEEDLKRKQLEPGIVEGLMRQYDVAVRLKEEMRSSAEEAKNMMDFLNRLVERNQPIKTPKKPKGPKGPEDPTPKMLEEISRRKVLIGLTEEQAKRQELVYQTEDKLGTFRNKYGNDFINNIVNQTMALDEQQKVLDEAKAKQKEVGDLISSSMEDAFMSIVDGTKSVKDAFKSMAASVISELYRIFVVKKIVGGITGFLGFADGGVFSGGSVVPSAKGNIFSGGNVVPFANGGVVSSPMTFPMTGGKTGLMGEAGPEAIMPLKRGKGGKLGVVAENNGNVVINQSFNFSANGDESVKKIIAQAAPQIAQMTKTSIINDRRRGGSTLAAFGR